MKNSEKKLQRFLELAKPINLLVESDSAIIICIKKTYEDDIKETIEVETIINKKCFLQDMGEDFESHLSEVFLEIFNRLANKGGQDGK